MFKKIVALKYYDGPLSGVATEDEAGEIIAKFDLLAWDSTEDWRIFCVGRIPDGNLLFRNIVEFYGQFEKEHWPVWIPTPRPIGEDKSLEFKQILDSHREYQFVVLSTQIHKEPTRKTLIKGELSTLVQEFIHSGQLQDFNICKKLIDSSADC